MDASIPLHTERLTLRFFESDDAEALLAIFGRADVSRFLTADPWPATSLPAMLARKLARRGFDTPERALSLAIERSGELIGDVALWLTDEAGACGEMGWVLHPSAAGKGFATEAAGAAIAHGFGACGLHRIAARVDPRNTASIAVAERLGMRREAHLRQDWWNKGEWNDTLIYALLASDPRPTFRLAFSERGGPVQ